MGHYVNLLASTEAAGVEELFSAKNYLPDFWLGLLDAAALDEPRKHWYYLAQLEVAGDYEGLERFTDILPAPTNHYVDRHQLQRNLARTTSLLRQHYPGQLPLFLEFGRYLLAHLPGPDDGLEVDLISLGNFTSYAEYLASLHQQVAAFEAGAPLPWALPTEPSRLVGFSYRPPDPAEYPLLSAATQTPARPPATPPARPGGWWRRLWGGR